MPDLEFRGKEFVRNHHLTVPFRPLLPDAAKSIGDGGLDGSLIIHGDNLHALKALLPRYAGKVDCIFIDPPYNTGNEGWSYNDNVNSPLMKEWLSSNPINSEDLLRHDKWCCMMWPRLKLLWELLAETGSLWMTLDDNEVGRARCMLDEIFGEESCIGQIAWQKRTSRENRATLSPSIDHLLVYSKSPKDTWRLRRNLLPPTENGYSNPDNDPRGPWRSIPFSAQGYRKNQVYTITTPSGRVLDPPPGRCWGATEPEFNKYIEAKRVYWPKDGDGRPRIKAFPEDEKGLVPDTLWLASDVGDTEESKKLLMAIMGEGMPLGFHAPKPPALVERVIAIAANGNALILDSFAGSGTTAHSVLNLRANAVSDHKFILVECEDYADTFTAERVRRVINGYSFTGTQRQTIFEKKLTWTDVKKGDALRAEAENTKALFGDRFDDVSIEVKDGTLRVVGERNVAENAPGLGGSFTYCTLGDAIDLDKVLSGESLPARAAMAEWLLYVAGVKMVEAPIAETDDAALREWYLGRDADVCYWLIYRPDKQFLLSREAALTLDLARRLKQFDRQRKHLVFAPAKYVSRKLLIDEKLPVEYANIPFSLFRLERD